MTYEEKMINRIGKVLDKIDLSRELNTPIVVHRDEYSLIEWALLSYLRYWGEKNVERE